MYTNTKYTLPDQDNFTENAQDLLHDFSINGEVKRTPFIEPGGFVIDRCAQVFNLTRPSHWTGDANILTLEVCDTFCTKQVNAVFFGVTAGKDCWCASNYHIYHDRPAVCNVLCPGDSSEICGGVDSTTIAILSHIDMENPMVISR